MPSPLEFPQNAFLLLARKADALRAARQLRERMEPFPTWAGAWYKHLLDYTCGTVSDEELLRLAGRSRWNQCEAHYCIGVNRLADGDRAGAAEHFRQARDTHVFNYFEYHWSERLLHRMEQDSTWPPWIPLKDCATSRPETQGGLGGRDREEAP
jgi:lipoprotein NlpI